MKPEKIVCNCTKTTIGKLQQAIENGASSYEELQKQTKVGTCCKKCNDYAKNVTNELLENM